MELKTVAALASALALTALAALAQGNEGELKWSFKMGDWVIASPAVAADGTIYAGSKDKMLRALTAEGKPLWSFKAGGEITSSPAIAADGTVYVGAGRGLHALTPEGTERWVFKGGDIFSTAALAADGTVYVNNRDHTLYALSSGGKLKWSFSMRSHVSAAPSSPAIAPDGTLYIGGPDGRLHALTAQGQPKWASRVAGDPILTSPSLGADGTIYVANANSELRVFTLHAFSPEGDLKWAFETTRGPPTSPHSPVIGFDGTLYYVANRLYAVTAQGKRLWAFASETIASAPSVGADGTIYFVTWNGKVYALTTEGTRKWSFETGGRSSNFPVLGADGTVFLGTEGNNGPMVNRENTVYAVKTSSSGYAASPWPSYQMRWMKHGGGQDARAQPPAVIAKEETPTPGAGAPAVLVARAALHRRGIPFAPERFLECATVGDVDCVRSFLGAEMRPDAQDELGGTALMRALGRGHLDVARLLLERGASPDAQDRYGTTALMSAAQFGRLPAAEVLLDGGANPNVQDKRGSTALDRASYHGRVDVAKALLRKGANPNHRSASGGTALMAAAQWGYLEVLRALLDHGADANDRDNDGKTALAHAQAHSRSDVTALLEAAAKRR